MQNAPPLHITLVEAAVFPWSDGDWVVQAEIEAANGLDQPAALAPDQFSITGTYNRWSLATTLPPTTVNPGQTVRGRVAWYCSRVLPQPIEARFSWTPPGAGEPAWQHDATLIPHPERTPAGPPFPVPPLPVPLSPPQPPVANGSGFEPWIQVAASQGGLIRECDVRFESPVAFHWSDGDWIVRVQATVTQRSGARLIIARALFAATANGIAMRPGLPRRRSPRSCRSNRERVLQARLAGTTEARCRSPNPSSARTACPAGRPCSPR